MNIVVVNTAGRSPWSNGLVERHNLVIAEMMDKVIADSNNDFDLSLAWCLSAKNSLLNVNGFSPFQIALGGNPTFPIATENGMPANAAVRSADIVQKNLNGLHAARRAYLETENSRKN